MFYINKANQEIDSFNSGLEVKKIEKTIKDETADWKTYRNKEAGYEIRYPQNLEVAGKDKAPIVFPHHLYLVSDDAPEAYIIITNLEEDIFSYIEDWKKLWKQEGTSFFSVKIGGKQGLKAISEEKKEVRVIIKNQGKFYNIRFVISANIPEADEIFNAELENFNQMLSTFKFVE